MGRRNPTNNEYKKRMQEALSDSNAEAVYQLHEDGFNLDMKYTGQKRAIYFAAQRDDGVVFDALIKCGASPNIPPVGTANPLYACLGEVRKNMRAAKRLLAAGADPAPVRDRGSKQKDFLVHKLARSGHDEALQLIIDAGAWRSLDQKSTAMRTPLEEAEHAITSSRTASVAEKREKLEDTIALLDYYAALPKLDTLGRGSLSKEALFGLAPENKHSVLEHPGTWEVWGDVVRRLAENGEHITKADLLDNENAIGTPWLDRAVSCYSFEEVLKDLNAHNESIGKSELINPMGDPSPLFLLMQDRRVLHQLFTPENTRHWSRDEFNAILRHTTDYDMGLCESNLHQLRAHADRYQRHQQRAEEQQSRSR